MGNYDTLNFNTLRFHVTPLREKMGNYDNSDDDHLPRMVTPLREKMGNYDERFSRITLSAVTPPREWFIHSSFRFDYTHDFIMRQLFFQFLPPFPQKVRHFSIKSAQPMTAETKPRKRMEKERNIMKNSNQINVPQAREAMDKFKMQAAQDVDGPVTY